MVFLEMLALGFCVLALGFGGIIRHVAAPRLVAGAADARPERRAQRPTDWRTVPQTAAAVLICWAWLFAE